VVLPRATLAPSVESVPASKAGIVAEFRCSIAGLLGGTQVPGMREAHSAFPKARAAATPRAVACHPLGVFSGEERRHQRQPDRALLREAIAHLQGADGEPAVVWRVSSSLAVTHPISWGVMIFWILVIVGVVIASVVWFHSRGKSLERERIRFLSRLTTANAAEQVQAPERARLKKRPLEPS
jgi:hypothetical protein